MQEGEPATQASGRKLQGTIWDVQADAQMQIGWPRWENLRAVFGKYLSTTETWTRGQSVQSKDIYEQGYNRISGRSRFSSHVQDHHDAN